MEKRGFIVLWRMQKQHEVRLVESKDIEGEP